MSSTWEITSPSVRRVIVFDPADGLYTSHFESLVTGTDLVAKARAASRWTPEFDFRVNGDRVTSLGEAWELVDVTDAYPQPSFPAQLVFHLRHPVRSLEVRVGYQCTVSGTNKRC